jgi:hypothetical protein
MLDMGFNPQVDRIVKRLPNDRQTMFFSATLDGEIGALAREYTSSASRYEADPPGGLDAGEVTHSRSSSPTSRLRRAESRTDSAIGSSSSRQDCRRRDRASSMRVVAAGVRSGRRLIHAGRASSASIQSSAALVGSERAPELIREQTSRLRVPLRRRESRRDSACDTQPLAMSAPSLTMAASPARIPAVSVAIVWGGARSMDRS